MSIFYRYVMTLTSAIQACIALYGAQAFQPDLAVSPPVQTTAALASTQGSGRGADGAPSYPNSSVISSSPTAYTRRVYPSATATIAGPKSGSEEESGPPIAVAVTHTGNNAHLGAYGIPVTYATVSAVDANALD